MEIITFDTYENAIQKFYETVKTEDLTGRLKSISPAVLRELCLGLYSAGLNADDLVIFRNFFNVNEEIDLRKAIENFDIGRSKSVINFIKNGTSPTDKLRVEMAAILIGYKPRPFKAFSLKLKQSNVLAPPSDLQAGKPGEEITAFQENVNPEAVIKKESAHKPTNEHASEGNTLPKKFSVAALLAIALLFAGYVIKKEIYPAKDCLQWTTDHYEAVSCKGAKIQSLYEARIIEWSAELTAFRKLTISEKTRFFINGKPAVWYSKDNNVVDFFNAPGVHPITGESLKPVTRHIVETYGQVGD
ncbi:hypothetical protein FNO01nite_33540 [Flavobacterium noncentrifugens]|uniref:Uncharacterized protein n=1 Tax=Flavobacterium noncentrifugens TaxID=1128970 RepID=A0A1G8Y8L2_9FLAO|nr:hypothetical protein [Flavobacterium noncentrifugens]GEP52682.1 hypothetical protein FNO01nite_33540 [Flavobacterium noncentrifugens]SDJ98555.1 hypothetical protein SAMN04487935_2214 [Flavobacterium noncentrifugens]